MSDNTPSERLMAVANRLRNFAVADRPSLDEIADEIELVVTEELEPQ